ncbi:hypothetical protein P7C70_g3259, partial [Phenoliferia sp. Uapishka_3]
MSFQQPPFGPGSAFAAFPTSTQQRQPRRAASNTSFDDKDKHSRDHSGPTPIDTHNSPPSHGAWESSEREREHSQSSSNGHHQQSHAHAQESHTPRSFSSILSPSLTNGNQNGNGDGYDGAHGDGGANGALSRPFVYSREFLLSLYDDEKATARRPIELAHHDIATRDKPAKPWALNSDWRDGEKELFATNIHPSSSSRSNRATPGGGSATTGGTLDLASLSPLPRDRDRERGHITSPSPSRANSEKDVVPGRRTKALGGASVVGIMGGVLGGIGVPSQRARASSPSTSSPLMGERKREGSGGSKEVWQGGRWRRGAAADGEDDSRPSAFGARRYPTAETVPTTDEALAAASRAPDEIPATWDGEDDDASPIESKAPSRNSTLPTPPDSDGLPAASEQQAPTVVPTSPDLSHHAASILGSLALDSPEDEDPIHHLLRHSSSSLPPPGLAPSPAPPTSDWQYRDPSGQIQGPFSPVMMHDWFRQNFFSGDLNVKRAHEREFEPLDQLIRRSNDKESPFLTAPLQPVAPPTQLPPPTPSASWSLGGVGNANGSFYEPFPTSVTPSVQQAFGGGLFGASTPGLGSHSPALDPWGQPLPAAQPQLDSPARAYAPPAWNDFGSPSPSYGIQPTQFAPSVAELFRQATLHPELSQQQLHSPAEQIFAPSRQIPGLPASPFFDPNQLSSSSQPDWSRLNGLPLQMPQNPLAQQPQQHQQHIPQPIGHNSWSSML